MNTNRDFRDSPVWQQSMTLAVEIHDYTMMLGKEYLYGLVSQIRASSNAIAAHLAEAYGRHNLADKINFYHYARASVFETLSHIEYCKNVELMDKDKFHTMSRNCKLLANEIGKIILKLRDKQTMKY